MAAVPPASAGLYDALGDGVLSTGEDARIIDLNERFREWVGTDRTALHGRPCAPVIRLAFGLDRSRWEALERGRSQRVAAYRGGERDHELVRIEVPADDLNPAQVMYVLRRMSYTGRLDSEDTEDEGLAPCVDPQQILDQERMVRQLYEWVARCWADARPFALLGLWEPGEALAPERLAELMSWAGADARLGALPQWFLRPLGWGKQGEREPNPSEDPSDPTNWRFVTLPGVHCDRLTEWIERHCNATAHPGGDPPRGYGAQIAELTSARLPRIEDWVMQLLTQVWHGADVPYARAS